MEKHLRNASLFIGLLIALVACAPEKVAVGSHKDAEHYFAIPLGNLEIQLQLALTPEERNKGLMFRDRLPLNHGMCFVFERGEGRGFWMRNTRIPLDIGYFDSSGKLLETYAMYPYDETSITSKSQDVLIAVEMNQGWYAKNKITPGAQLDLSALSQAIIARGKVPSAYSLR